MITEGALEFSLHLVFVLIGFSQETIFNITLTIKILNIPTLQCKHHQYKRLKYSFNLLKHQPKILDNTGDETS